MVGDMDTLQTQGNFCVQRLSMVELNFNVQKSAMVRFSGHCADSKVLRLETENVMMIEKYRYPGVTLINAPDYSDEHQAHLRQAAQRGRDILSWRILWNSNKYMMIRELWKVVF